MTGKTALRLFRHAPPAVLLLALTAAPAAAKHQPVDSWGRPGVDFDTYRNDALECGLIGYYADVSQTKQAQDFVTATRKMESLDNVNFVPASASVDEAVARSVEQAARYEQVRTSIRPEQEMRELKQGMLQLVAVCLKQRGYVRFRLTEDQRKALNKLKKGSDERKHYLFRLASDPDVLSAQTLAGISA
jgi:hypothetical protein